VASQHKDVEYSLLDQQLRLPQWHRQATPTILLLHDQPNMYQFVLSFDSHTFGLYIEFRLKYTDYFYIISIYHTVTQMMFTVVT